MDADAYPQEVLADEEPKYLRRQKPLEIKRRKFGRKAWMTYLRVSLWIAAGLAAAGMAYVVANFLLHFARDAADSSRANSYHRQSLRAACKRAGNFCRRPQSQRAADSARRTPPPDRVAAVGRTGHRTPRPAEPRRSRDHRAHSDRVFARRQRYEPGGRATE